MESRSITKYIGRKVAYWIFSIFGAFAITFLFFHLIPGNPIEAFIGTLTQQTGGGTAGSAVGSSAEMIASYISMFGLDKPIHVQFFLYLKNMFLEGDMGLSLMAYPNHAQVPIMAALPWTIGLLGISTLIAWVLGVVFGGVLGWTRDHAASKVITLLALAFNQIPNYLLALFLLMTLGYGLAWFPTRGAYPALMEKTFTLPFIWEVVRHAMLPAMSVVVVALAGWILSSRSLIISLLGEDYLLFAEAKGLPPARIFGAYALRNAMLPQVTALGMSLGFVVNGLYLVEWFYTYPGMGWTFVRAIRYLDYAVIQGTVFISISAVLTANLIIDLLLPLVDPRVRRS